MSHIIDRKKSVVEILSANRRFAAPTAAELESLLSPHLRGGETMPDVELLQRLFGRALDDHWRQLSNADETSQDVSERHAERTVERDAAAGRLYREVVDLRQVLRGRFGLAASSRFVGLTGRTSRDPVVLLRQADRAATRLRDLSRPTPASGRWRQEDRLRRARRVASSADALRDLLEEVTGAGKEADAARLDRGRLLSAFNGAFVAIAGCLAALYRVVGRTEWAEIVLPSRQYPGLTHREAKKRPRKGAKPKAVPLLSFPRLRPILGLFDSRRKTS